MIILIITDIKNAPIKKPFVSYGANMAKTINICGYEISIAKTTQNKNKTLQCTSAAIAIMMNSHIG